jgi:hypothetical protein
MVIFLAAPSMAETAAGASDRIKISHEPCSNQVTLIARDVALSEVLQALAFELQFELHFKSDHDRAISMELRKPARELIETLGRDDNIMITNKVDVRCNAPVDRLMAVWFLGTGPEVVYQPATVTAAYKLPETGGPQTQTARKSDDDDKENKQQKKRRSQMTPEERYVDRINRKNQKRYGIE